MHRCLQYKALEYLVDCCTLVSDIPSRRHLWLATRHYLTIPRYRLSTFGRRAFSVAGPTVCNSLPDSLHTLHDLALTSNSFRQSLKTNLFHRCQHTQCSRDASWLRYINLLLTLRLTVVNTCRHKALVTIKLTVRTCKYCIITLLSWSYVIVHSVVMSMMTHECSLDVDHTW